MHFVKATKCFRTTAIILSLVCALTSIILLCCIDQDCSQSNLKATTGLVFFLWSTVFVLMLLQAVKLTDCLKKIPKLLFGFYFFVCGCMFFCQMELWGGVDNNCRNEVPSLYWWLVCNIALFYFIVSFGLAVWGSYICKVVDTQEEITKVAVKEYLEETTQNERHFMIKAGSDSTPLLLQNGADAPAPSVQRMMLTDGQNPYSQQAHSQQTMDKYNNPEMVRMQTQLMQQQQQIAMQQQMLAAQPASPMMIQQQPMMQQQQPMLMQPQMPMQARPSVGPQMMAQQSAPIAMAPPNQQQPIAMMPQSTEQLD